MTEVGRNRPCPCGSGAKYKRCCLRREHDAALDALEAERVWDRMQDWALERFGDEVVGAHKGHLGARGVGSEERPANEEDLTLTLGWVLIDRELANGCTLARHYSERPELEPGERRTAERIAACRLGLHRVTDVEPGAWIDLENVLGGQITRVSSPNVSREAVRWHVLMCRVMDGPSPSLWGAAGFYEPAEESELLAELRRIADELGLGDGTAGLEAALRVGAGELVCFVPPSRRAERVPYTLEGDPVALAEATWRVRQPRVALAALRAAPELTSDGETDGGDAVTFDWLSPRRGLVARRAQLPVGAIVIEGGPIGVGTDGELEVDDVTSLGTFTLYEDRLDFFGMSEARLAAAVQLVKRHLGSAVGQPRPHVQSMANRLSTAWSEEAMRGRTTAGAGSRDPGQGEGLLVPDARIREVTCRRWIDDPDHRSTA